MPNNITVDLSTTPITYQPGPEVKHGDTVTFSLSSLPSGTTAVVTFPNGTCLTLTGPFNLGGTQAAATSQTVSATAPKGIYNFEATINAPSRKDQDPKLGPIETDRKNGGIDVTSDPPEGR